LLISIVIPALNEERSIDSTLDAVTALHPECEVIVVDGGSTDRTVELVTRRRITLIASERGRGSQMHAGASLARGDVLWFLHADSRPAPESLRLIAAALQDRGVAGGHFQVQFDGDGLPARFMTWLYPRLDALGLCYGDSGIFVRADVSRRIGGFKSFPIFEDLDLVKRLKRAGRLARLRAPLFTSSRRFENRSFVVTFSRWALLQLLYWIGVHPRRLVSFYTPVRG
jgi:rSAM/selenodomain-associated transferase 2